MLRRPALAGSNPSAHLSVASLDGSLRRPSDSCPIPSTEDPRLPVFARLRRSGLGLTTVHPYKDTRPPEPCRGGAGRKRGFCGDSRDGDTRMARRWRGMARGTGGDRSGQGGTAVGRHQLRPRGPTDRIREVLAANTRREHKRAPPRERRCVSKAQAGAASVHSRPTVTLETRMFQPIVSTRADLGAEARISRGRSAGSSRS
jgi:hypothetical protein